MSRRPALVARRSSWVLALLVVALGTFPTVASSATPSFGRHYEVVTPADKLGQGTYVGGISPDGNVVRFSELGGNGLPGSESQEPLSQYNVHLATRDARHWEQIAMSPAWSLLQGLQRSVDSTPSLDEQLFFGYNDVADTRTYAFYTRRPGQSPERVSVEFRNRAGMNPSRPRFAGSSADLKHLVFSGPAGDYAGAEAAYLPTDPLPWPNGASPQKLYESVAADPPILRRVDVDDAGEPINPPDACLEFNGATRHAEMGSVSRRERAVSVDGRRIFFTVAPDCASRRLFARVDGTSTVDLSASECNRLPACEPRSGDDVYESASADGRFVFFTSPNQLTDSDTDSTADLYRYDFDAPSGQRLTLLSEGDATNETPGSGADVRAVLRTSEDGGRIYFVAGGVLTTDTNDQGQAATAGENNLYVFDAGGGGVRFVATLDPAADWQLYGSSRPAQLADPAGRYLVLGSFGRLTADDTDNTRDIFRYDAVLGRLQRVSVGSDGFGADGNDEIDATIAGPDYGLYSQTSASSSSRNVSTDGQRIVFATPEALQEDDTNDAYDVYEWHDGKVGLVSDGKDPAGTGDPNAGNKGFMIAADGSAVAFSTAQRLLPKRDVDTAADVYVARLGSDVEPLPAPPPGPCSGEACQGEVVATAPQSGVPGSVTFSGGGSIVAGPLAPAGKVSVSKVRAIVGSQGNLKVTVPAGGRVSVSGGGLKASRRTVGKPGTYSVKVALSARATRTLKRRGSVRATVKLAFTPAVGSASSVRMSLTFRSGSKRKGRS